MASMPIEWHEQCIKNSSQYLDRKLAELDRLKAEVERISADIDLHKKQIVEAKNRGVTSFDREKLLKPKKTARPGA